MPDESPEKALSVRRRTIATLRKRRFLDSGMTFAKSVLARVSKETITDSDLRGCTMRDNRHGRRFGKFG